MMQLQTGLLRSLLRRTERCTYHVDVKILRGQVEKNLIALENPIEAAEDE